jgi:hypothetical protein
VVVSDIVVVNFPFILPFLFRFAIFFPSLIFAIAACHISISHSGKTKNLSASQHEKINNDSQILQLYEPFVLTCPVKMKITEISISEQDESHHVNVTNTS